MPLKEIKLVVRDLAFFAIGDADVAAADCRSDPWLYALDWSYQLDREKDYFEPKDAAGIPLRDYPGTLGKQYLISRIATYALAHWNRWRSDNSEHSRQAFFAIVKGFPPAPNGRHEHHFPVAGMQVPWISCISQGEAASMYSRAFVATQQDEYLQQAYAAIAPLLNPVESGGLQSKLPDGRPFLEEYPGTIYRHVLNGCLYAVLGLHDTIRASPSPVREHVELFRDLIDALAHNVNAWDIAGWSTYDFPQTAGGVRNLNTMTYQVLQATLLLYLAEVSGSAPLRVVGERWLQNTRHLSPRLRALAQKLRYRIVARW